MKIVVIEPGAVTTGMLDQVDVRGRHIVSGMTTEQRGRYGALMQAVISQAKASVPGGASPEMAARVIADAITSKRPRTRYTVGSGTAMIIRLTKLLSDRTLDSLLARSLKPHLRHTSPPKGGRFTS